MSFQALPDWIHKRWSRNGAAGCKTGAGHWIHGGGRWGAAGEKADCGTNYGGREKNPRDHLKASVRKHMHMLIGMQTRRCLWLQGV